MSNEPIEKDTLWTHEPPTEPGWYWRCGVDCLEGWGKPDIACVEKAGQTLYVREGGTLEKCDSVKWWPLPLTPPSPANAPVLSQSEPKEGESKPPFFQLLVDSLNETKDRGPAVISREKLQRLVQGFMEFDKAHAEDVEAAYREGWKDSPLAPDTGHPQELTDYWNASEAKKKLEGR